ncbi:MAG: hypothetical protein WKG01_31655 [Kofleriaceae bacterium]
MKMRTLRRLRAQAPRQVRRPAVGGAGDRGNATMEPDPGPPPEAVFDRLTGPYGRRYDEET